MNTLTRIVSAHIGAAIILCAIGVFLSWKSIEIGVIKEGVFLGLVALTVLVSFLVAFMWKIDNFTLGPGTLKATLREVKRSESTVKELAVAIIRVMDADAKFKKDDAMSFERFNHALAELKRLSE